MTCATRSAGIICLIGALGAAGCAPRSSVMLNYPHAPRATLTQTAPDHYQSVSNVADRDRQALIEDIDILFLTDRPTRLTRWHGR